MEILKFVPKESVDKIPQTMIDTFKAKMDNEYDFKVDINTKKIISIFLPSPVKSWFNKAEDIELSWDKIVKIGVDVLIVDASSVIEEFKENNV